VELSRSAARETFRSAWAARARFIRGPLGNRISPVPVSHDCTTIPIPSRAHVYEHNDRAQKGKMAKRPLKRLPDDGKPKSPIEISRSLAATAMAAPSVPSAGSANTEEHQEERPVRPLVRTRSHPRLL